MSGGRPTLGRRTFLGAAAGSAVLAGAGPSLSRASAATEGDGVRARRTGTFAFVTDVHINAVPEDGRTEQFRRVMRAVEADSPDLVISAGDMTDFGLDEECEDYWSCVPDSLRSKMRHVPGNHEMKWDWSVYANYERFFGPRNTVTTVDGLHFVMLDTSVLQQNFAYLRAETRKWLRRTLEAIGAEPSIVVTHLPPMGDRYYFLPNQDDFADVVERYPVRGILCGHTHAERVLKNNGSTLLVGKDAKRHAGYYRMVRTTGRRGDLLTVTYVEVPEATRSTDAPVRQETPVTTIDLADPHGPGGDLAPDRTRVRCDSAGEIAVRARYPAAAPLVGSAVTLYNPDTFLGRDPDVWTPLEPSRPWHEGVLSIADRPPGLYRVIVRSTDADADEWREIVDVEKPGREFRPLWTHRLDGSIHGCVAQHSGLVVVATTSGAVLACRPRGGARRPRWKATVGGVYNDPAFTTDGTAVYVPVVNGMYALDADDGSRRWHVDLDAPVVSDPCALVTRGREKVVVAAGLTMYRLDGATGDQDWSLKMERMTAGRPAVVGDTVYFGGGDGDAWAVDVHTGTVRWRLSLTEGTKDRLGESPWTTNPLALPGGLMMFSTNGRCLAVDLEARRISWSKEGNYMYCPPALVDGKVLVVERLSGVASLLEPATGAVLWEREAVPDAQNPGILVAGGSAYVTGSNGTVARLDARGDVQRLRQTTRAYVAATPALADDGGVFVLGDQDGVVRAFAT